MPTHENDAPGVYVEEVPVTPSITGVSTSTAAFIGVSEAPEIKRPIGPDGNHFPLADLGEPQLVTNFEQFKRYFGDFDASNRVLAHSVYGFFNNGGSVCWVARVGDLNDAAAVEGVLKKFAAIDEIAVVAAPGSLEAAIQTLLVNHCDNLNMQDRFAILDGKNVDTFDGPEDIKVLEGTDAGKSDYAAVYYPFVKVFDPDSEEIISIPPSGLMAGIYARVDNSKGVHKAPANEGVRGALGLDHQTSKAEQALVNRHGVNVIRPLNGSILVWGARTQGSADNTKIRYINVRRLMIFLRESIDEGTQFAVFEPNANPLWQKITRTVTAFLTRVWRDGALFGVQPEQAFYVKCDESTNPPDMREIGHVIVEVGVAPVKPAEFVVFRIAQFAEIPTA